MKKILLTGVAGLAMVAGAPAMAEPNGPYIAGDIGYHWPGDMDTIVCTGVIALIWIVSSVRIYAKQQGAAAKKELTESTALAAILIALIGLFWTIVGIIQGVGGNFTG